MMKFKPEEMMKKLVEYIGWVGTLADFEKCLIEMGAADRGVIEEQFIEMEFTWGFCFEDNEGKVYEINVYFELVEKTIGPYSVENNHPYYWTYKVKDFDKLGYID